MSTNHAPAAPAADVPDARRLRAILVAVSVALMAVIASVSGLTVAQTHLAVDFGASQTDVLWMINIYTLTLAALLLPLGALGDRWGRKPMLLAGLALFGVASVAAALAPNSATMLAARTLSGAGAAMIMPITLAVITSSFPAAQRSRAIGVWTAVAGGGGILGMFLSALLVDVASWRWLFVLPVVLTAAALVMTVTSVPDSRERSGHPFDLAGAMTSTVAVVGLICVLQEGPGRGWSDPVTVIVLAVGLVALAVFVAWELRRRDAALLDVRLFRERGLAGGSVTLLIVFGVQAGISVVLFPFFQAVLGWSGLLSTLALMPMAGAMMVAAGLAPHLAARIGARATMASGVALGAAGLALMALILSVDGGYLSVLPGMLAMGIGMGLAMTPSTEAITASLPRGKQGVASALNDVTRELGTALGVAMLGALLSAGYRASIADKLADVPGVPGDTADSAREGIATAMDAAHDEGTHTEYLVGAAQQAFVDGWQQAIWVGAAVMGALFLFVLARGPSDHHPEPAEEAELTEPAGDAGPTEPAEEAGPTEPAPVSAAGTPPGRSRLPCP